MVTEEEKNVYNTYLRISRTKKGEPYKVRKNFDKFEDTDKHLYTRRLVRLFSKHRNIKWNDFFTAPYELYPDDTKFDLKFYTTPKAIKAYSLHMAKKESDSPDNRIDEIKSSYLYIFQFCRDNNLQLEEYLHHMTSDLNSFVLHIRNHDICIHALFGLADFEATIAKIPVDRLEFTVGKYASNIPLLRTRFYGSQKAKSVTSKCADKIKNLLLTTRKPL